MRVQLLLILVVIVALLAAGAGLAYWLGIPRLQAFSPADGASALPAGVQIRLTFSQSMQTETVIQRLEIDPERPGSFSWQESEGQPDRTLVFTPEQPWEAGATVNVALLPGARSAGMFSPAMRQRANWSFRIRQPELAYLYPSSGPSTNIYVLNPLSGASSLLTQNMGVVQDFSVNTSGSAIYYSSRTGMDSSTIFRLDLALAEPDSTAQETATPAELPPNTQILHCPRALCRAAEISPDGKYLAYERTAFPGSGSSSLPQVWVLPLDTQQGKVEPEPFLAGNPDHETLQPAWSPQGMLNFYDRTDQAFMVVDMQSGQQYRFPNQTGEPGSWHPGGQQFIAPEILFVSVPDAQALASSHLISFNWQTEKTQDLTPGEDLEDTAPAFSPDGDYLAFTRKFLDLMRWTPGRQVWILHLPSSAVQRMTNDPDFNHFDLTWSPAGDQLAYVRFNQTTPTEPPEIWLMDPLTGRAIQIVIGGFSPQWIP